MAFDADPCPASRFVTIYVIFIRVENGGLLQRIRSRLVVKTSRGAKGSIQGRMVRAGVGRVGTCREMSRRDGSTHFWGKFSRRCTSACLEEESVDAKGSPLSPGSWPTTSELSSFAMHSNLPRIIHIHKWRMHIRDKFPRGVPSPPRFYAPKCKLFSGQIESWWW